MIYYNGSVATVVVTTTVFSSKTATTTVLYRGDFLKTLTTTVFYYNGFKTLNHTLVGWCRPANPDFPKNHHMYGCRRVPQSCRVVMKSEKMNVSGA